LKKIKVVDKKSTLPSQNKVKYEHSQMDREYSSITQPVYFVFSNRWGVEVGKSMITSGSQAASKVALVENDLGSESFLNQIAASQTGVTRFVETRLLSSLTLKQRTLEALRRADEKRNELLRQEEDVEIDL
jgi:hypothetical protein